MSDDFERRVRDWLRGHGPSDLRDLEALAGYVAVLPPRRPDRRRPLALVAAIVVLLGAAVFAVPRFGQVSNVAEPTPSPRVATPPDPAAFAGDPRLKACFGSAGPVEFAFEMAHARDYRLHLPRMGRSPELDTDEPAFVVVFARDARPWQPTGATVSATPRSASAAGGGDLRSVCVLVGDAPTAYDDVDITGMRAVIPPTSPSVAPSTTPAGWVEPSTYAFVLESLCGERSLIGRFSVRVEGGRRVEVAPIPPTRASGEDAPTLAALLAHVEAAKGQGADRVEVKSDPADGHPTKVDIDWNANAIDDEECYRITDYVVLEPAATTPPAVGGSQPSPPPYARDLLGELQCDASPQSIGGEIGDVAPVGATGTASWGPWLDAVDDVDLPLTGWQEDPRTPWENGESNYVRYVNRVEGRVKAVIVMSGRSTQGGPGFWQVVAFRACQPAEFDALRGRTTDDAPWRDGTGAVTETVTTSAGPAHCGWESTVWLRYQGSLYLRDPLRLFAKVEAGAFSADARLPSGARDTGFRSVGRELWVTDDPSFVWIRSSDRVERWPRSSEELGCV